MHLSIEEASNGRQQHDGDRLGSRSPAPRRVGSLRKLARRRSTTALLLCAAADPADRRPQGLSDLLRDLPQHARPQDGRTSSGSTISSSCSTAPSFQLVIFQSCLFADHRGDHEGAARLHPGAPDAQHPRQEPAHLARPAAGAVGHSAGAVDAHLVVAVRSVLFRVQLDAELARLRRPSRSSAPRWNARICGDRWSTSGSARRSS